MNDFKYLDGYLTEVSRNLKKNLLFEMLETLLILFLSLTAISVSICVSLGFAPLVRVIYFSMSALLLLSSAAYFLYVCRKVLSNHNYLADFIEERIALDYGLKTYVELKNAGSGVKRSFSEALFAANAAQTAKKLSNSDPKKVTEHKRAVKLLAVLLAMVLTIVSLAIAFPGGFSQGVKNLFAIEGENFLFFQTPVKVKNLLYDARIEIFPPSYLGFAETNIVTGSMDITIPAGASVKISGRTGGDVTGGALIFMDDKEIKHYLLDNVNDNRPEVRFQPPGKGKYIFRMQKSSGIIVEEEQWHSIEIKDDMPPEVDIIPPTNNILKAGEEIKIELSAVDDYGLRAIDIVFSPQGGDASVEERKRVYDLSGEKFFSGFVIFRMPEIDPLEGGGCNLWFEAFDNDPSPKKKGKSAIVEFITDKPEIRISKDIESLAEIFDRLVAQLDMKLTGKKDKEESGTEIVNLISKAGEVLRDLNRYLPEITGESVFQRLAGMCEKSIASIKGGDASGTLIPLIEEAALLLDKNIRTARLELLKRRWNEFLSIKRRLEIMIGSGADEGARGRILTKIDKLLKRLSVIEKEIGEFAMRIPAGHLSIKRKSPYETAASQIQNSLISLKDAVKEGKTGKITALMDLLDGNIRILSDIFSGGQLGFGDLFSPEEREKIAEFLKTLEALLNRQRRILEVTAEYSYKYTKLLNEIVKPEIEKLLPQMLTKVEKIREKINSAAKLNLDKRDADEIAGLNPLLENITELLGIGNIDISLKLIGRLIENASFLRDEFEEIAGFSETKEAQEYGKAGKLFEKALLLANDLGADMKRIFSETDKFYSKEEVKEINSFYGLQKEIVSRMEKVQTELEALLGDYLEKEKDILKSFANALAEMKEAAQFLRMLKPKGAEESERRAIQEVLKGKRGLEKILEKPGEMIASVEEEHDWVEIPKKQQGGWNDGIRHEIESLKDKPVRGYEDMVKKYYEEIVQ